MAQNPGPVNVDFLLGATVAIVSAFIGAATQYLLEGRRTRNEKKEQWVKTALEWAANGRKESLRRVDLRKADLRGADLRDADLTMADLSYADLRGAKLSGADLRGAKLSGADLTLANLRMSKYSTSTTWPSGFDYKHSGAFGPESDLHGENLTYANLRGDDLSGANLEGAILTRASLYRVVYDDKTRWPDGFDPVAAGAILVTEKNEAKP